MNYFSLILIFYITVDDKNMYECEKIMGSTKSMFCIGYVRDTKLTVIVLS